MASLKEMRNRIGSVKATQKITKAMQMVAAAKLRRAQLEQLARERAESGREIHGQPPRELLSPAQKRASHPAPAAGTAGGVGGTGIGIGAAGGTIGTAATGCAALSAAASAAARDSGGS